MTVTMPHHHINVRTLPKRGTTVKLVPNDAERGSIALANDLNEVTHFEAECLVRPWNKKGVEVAGSVRVTVIQPCAISGEPLEAKVDELITAVFLPESSELRKPVQSDTGEIVLEYDGDDAPEYFSGDEIDLYEIVMEFFVLGLNPFLRLEDAEPLPEVDDAAAREDSPFAVLKGLKKS